MLSMPGRAVAPGAEQDSRFSRSVPVRIEEIAAGVGMYS